MGLSFWRVFAEMIAVDELYQKIAKEAKSPIIVFNGELDRIRSGYYPALFFPKLGKLAKSFIPNFESAYYIHNFKGNRGGAVSCYPNAVSLLFWPDLSFISIIELLHVDYV